MRYAIKSLIGSLFLMIITGCAVKEFKSSGRVASSEGKIHDINLMINTTPPSTIKMFVLGDRANPPKIDQVRDGSEAAKKGEDAIKLLKNNLSVEFERHSKKRGLSLTDSGASPRLHIHVSKYHYFRSNLGTSTGLELVGNLNMPNQTSAIWSFNSVVSPLSVYHDFDVSLVSSFAQRLVDELYADGVVLE